MKNRAPYVYTICRIDTKDWQNINKELAERGYEDIKCFVPTLSMVKKTYRGQRREVELVPLLFNYGFVKMSSERAYNRNFLFKLKKEIPGIVSFLKSVESMHPKKKRRRVDNAEDWDDFSKVAIVSRKEFRHYKRLSRANHIYNLDEVRVRVGDYVTLRGYPMDGMLAKIIDFNFPNKTAIIEIYPGEGSVLSMQIPLENVLYSPYEHYQEDLLSSKIEIQDLSNQPALEQS